MSDLPKRLRIKASMINLGERIAWGSEAALMDEAAAVIETLRAENERLDREAQNLSNQLGACDRERLRLRAELAALKAVPDGVEVAGYRWKTEIPEMLGGGYGWSYASHWSTGPEDAEPLMTVSQHNAIVAGLGDPVGSFDKCIQAMQDRDEHAKTIDKLRLELHALRQPVAKVVGWYLPADPFHITANPNICAQWRRDGETTAPVYAISAPAAGQDVSGLAEALRSADWSGVSIGNKALILASVQALAAHKAGGA